MTMKELEEGMGEELEHDLYQDALADRSSALAEDFQKAHEMAIGKEQDADDAPHCIVGRVCRYDEYACFHIHSKVGL